ncbi:MAG: transcription termination/antitermination protein NusG [bacterium]
MTKEWYAVHTYSGFENKVKKNIEHRVEQEGFREFVSQVIIPEERIVEMKSGKKKVTTRNLMPGYLLLEMEKRDDIIEMVKKINGVSDFVGDGTHPIPLGEAEVRNILDILEDKKEKPKPQIKFRPGEQVKVVEGPFLNFVGTVEEIDEDKSKLKIMVSIFGRPTPVELDVLQVETT